MNKKEKENFKLIIDKYTDICINIKTFTYLLKDSDLVNLLDPVTDVKTIKEGMYGHLGAKRTRCWLHKNIKEGHIKIALREPKDNRNENDWSLDYKLEDFDFDIFDRTNKMKAFW